MIDRPEDHAGSTAPCKCPIGGACLDGGPHCYAQGIGGPGFTGNPPGMLQDDSRGLSQWLASKPDAMRHAREAAQAIRTLPNCAVECEALCQMSTRGYCERPRRSAGGWSDSGSQEGV